jgi:hypothetical protein
MMRSLFMRRRQSGTTLVEISAATLIVGLLMLIALQAAGQSIRMQRLTADRKQGRLLAEGLLSEIAGKMYSDATPPPAALGPDSGETERALFDDVDDYAGFVDSPLKDRTGAAYSGRAGWQRRVAVEWVNPADMQQIVLAESGIKRVAVEAWYGSTLIAKVTTIKSRAP